MARKSTLDDIPLEGMTPQQRYYIKNQEKLRERQRVWRAEHPEIVKAYNDRRNEKRKEKLGSKVERPTNGRFHTSVEIMRWFKRPDDAAAAVWVAKHCKKKKGRKKSDNT